MTEIIGIVEIGKLLKDDAAYIAAIKDKSVSAMKKALAAHGFNRSCSGAEQQLRFELPTNLVEVNI